jgi:hypothetical protein
VIASLPRSFPPLLYVCCPSMAAMTCSHMVQVFPIYSCIIYATMGRCMCLYELRNVPPLLCTREAIIRCGRRAMLHTRQSSPEHFCQRNGIMHVLDEQRGNIVRNVSYISSLTVLNRRVRCLRELH